MAEHCFFYPLAISAPHHSINPPLIHHLTIIKSSFYAVTLRSSVFHLASNIRRNELLTSLFSGGTLFFHPLSCSALPRTTHPSLIQHSVKSILVQRFTFPLIHVRATLTSPHFSLNHFIYFPDNGHCFSRPWRCLVN